MHRDTYWSLNIHYWPLAAAEGVRPVPTLTCGNQPQDYCPHVINFANPPSRQDFEEVVAQVPWMQQAWNFVHGDNTTFMAIVAQNPWPLVEPGFKAADVDLVLKKGDLSILVGRLTVSKEQRWVNDSYLVPFFSVDLRNKAARYCRDRKGAERYLDQHKLVILERVVVLSYWNDTHILAEARRLLVEGGFLKGKKPAIQKL